jgi:hypothetical protein
MSTFTQAQLNNLEAMIASGVLKSEYDGQRVEYRSLVDLIRARDMVRASLQSSAVRVTHFNPAFDRGL